MTTLLDSRYPRRSGTLCGRLEFPVVATDTNQHQENIRIPLNTALNVLRYNGSHWFVMMSPSLVYIGLNPLNPGDQQTRRIGLEPY